ncbi:FAR1-RELATED SEQUENCE 5-like [Olea europaea subsp. europaea]|uniref:Protein FAR1-RELATED SEQUENCE n=1 Tax=Olea europaea subsp. europaea TaxID=158383 RepID=A0A8S0UYQ3_OLEEU|nr:FAR1-RELATED SEQUENCE 5-like [Olea europaea subsp. europaea]
MIEKYNLHDNDWLSGLYSNRGRWVPCYLKCMFWAAMLTTQRSESMNAFFDGYVHSKTSLKQFVEQYERALRNKVEKEFRAYFKSYSQMVPCAKKYELEKQFQLVYTISKFRKVQDEFIGKVYCDLISSLECFSGTRYEVLEDVILYDRLKKKRCYVTFEKEKCEIVCSCHLFEFRGIICRHAIAILIRNNITSLPDSYILRRWRRDVSRAHTKVVANYDGLSSSPAQLRYDKLCQSFASLANLVAEDDEESRQVMEWIDCKEQTVGLTRSIGGSNNLAQQASQIALDDGASHHFVKGSVQDPKYSNKKGVPKKLRRKRCLESNSSNAKSHPTLVKGRKTKAGPSKLGEVESISYSMQAPVSYSQLLMGAAESHAFTQQQMSPNFIPLDPTNAMLYGPVGNAMPNYYPHVPY